MRFPNPLEYLSLLKVQFLKRYRIGSVDLQHATTKIADINGRTELSSHGSDDRISQLIIGSELCVTTPRHQLTDDRSDLSYPRLLLGWN